MLTATLLALGAAVLHATWNLAVKQSGARYLALWGQFAVAGVIGIAVIVVAGGLPRTGWMWAERTAMMAALRGNLLRFTVLGMASMLTYGMVQVAFEHAPVGYVTALRESSVVIAALAGSRLLGEANARRRVMASGVVLGGLVVLVAAR